MFPIGKRPGGSYESIIKLSDAFEDTALIGIAQDRPFDLDLSVKVYKINQGQNELIIHRCEKLDWNSAIIAKVRECEGEMTQGGKPQELTEDEKMEAMTKAIRWCIAHNILKPFLETHGTEVVNMLMTEWKLEDALVVERAEGREEGLEKGREEGLEEGIEKGLEKGLEKGKEEIAKNALAKGLSLDIIQDITGLSIEAIRNLTTR
jgi:predicted transposase/invertase (TIGR01784 family)